MQQWLKPKFHANKLNNFIGKRWGWEYSAWATVTAWAKSGFPNFFSSVPQFSNF